MVVNAINLTVVNEVTLLFNFPSINKWFVLGSQGLFLDTGKLQIFISHGETRSQGFVLDTGKLQIFISHGETRYQGFVFDTGKLQIFISHGGTRSQGFVLDTGKLQILIHTQWDQVSGSCS